jgi:peptide chain release factor 1
MKFELDNLIIEYENIEKSLADSNIYNDPVRLKELMQKKKVLEWTIILYKEYKSAHLTLEDAKNILKTSSDSDLIQIAKEDLDISNDKIIKLEEKLKIALLPKDKNDDKNVMLEIRAGTWWEESALFARELTNSYLIYAKSQNFITEILSESISETWWYKEVIIKINWFWAYSKFKFEAWTHRVQRIPETENKWRVHTSAITIAILPEAEEIDVQIRDEDLEIQTCRASGAWWQHINKTDSAIRMVHKPTWIVVECQDQRSQLKNKEKALSILRTKIYAFEEAKKNKEISDTRSAQVWSGDRSEKIRTYNFPQDRVTDHRIWKNYWNLPGIMMWKIWSIIDDLIIWDQTIKLSNNS